MRKLYPVYWRKRSSVWYAFFVVLLSMALSGICLTIISRFSLEEKDQLSLSLQSIALSVAISSLFVTGYGLVSGSTWNSRLVTLQAWNDWYAENSGVMRCVGGKFPDGPTKLQSSVMRKPESCTDDQMKEADFESPEEARRFHDYIVGILGGLEHIALGVQSKVYDLETIRQLGGTLVHSVHDSFNDYIETVRSSPQSSRNNQKGAYCGLSDLDAKLQDRYWREGKFRREK